MKDSKQKALNETLSIIKATRLNKKDDLLLIATMSYSKGLKDGISMSSCLNVSKQQKSST